MGLCVGGELLLPAAARDPGCVRRLRGRRPGRSMAEQRRLPGVAPGLRWVSPALAEPPGHRGAHGSPAAAGPRRAGRAVAPRPVLLLAARHGHEGRALNRVYRDAAPRTTALWEVPRGGHVGALEAQPGAYADRVLGFLDRALAG